MRPPLVKLPGFAHKQRVPPASFPALSPAPHGSDEVVDRRAVAHDLWPRRLILQREGQPLVLPARVLWPAHEDDVVRIVREARAARRPLVPFGAGSGVCGGISPTSDAWILDLKRMDRVRSIDTVTRRVDVEAGVIGERLEERLNARGLTLGHFPSSIACSTVGGWVATRSAGQLSSRYGKIEDMVLALWGVDGRGERIHAAIDDEATGPGAVQLLVGSEGALAVITRVLLRVHPLASHRWLRGYQVPDVAHGVEAMRALMQAGEAPSVLRLYDGADSALAAAAPRSTEPDRVSAGGIARVGPEDSGPKEGGTEEPTLFEQLAHRVDDLALFSHPRAARRIIGEILGRPQLANAILDRLPQRARIIIGIEGDADDILARVGPLRARLEGLGCEDIGLEAGERWLRHRHRVSYRMSRAFAAGAWVDTFEVATPWEGVVLLHRELRAALSDVAVVMCHMSHAYVDGCSLYFTFAGGGGPGPGPRGALARYDTAWSRALAVAKKHGAATSHHHGIGRSKVGGFKMAPAARALLATLKQVFDPDNILNPGVLGLGSDA